MVGEELSNVVNTLEISRVEEGDEEGEEGEEEDKAKEEDLAIS